VDVVGGECELHLRLPARRGKLPAVDSTPIGPTPTR
jgi:hypothetical protein